MMQSKGGRPKDRASKRKDSGLPINQGQYSIFLNTCFLFLHKLSFVQIHRNR